MPYEFFKDAHSILRWVVILTGLYATLRVWNGLLNKREWEKKDRVAGAIFTGFLNLQFLLGLALYALSPITKPAMKNFAAAMQDPVTRFFAIEHPVSMLLAVVIAQVGFTISKRASTDHSKFVKAALCYTIAGLLVLAGIPWPFLPYGRPLFPTFGG